MASRGEKRQRHAERQAARAATQAELAAERRSGQWVSPTTADASHPDPSHPDPPTGD